MVSLMGLNDDSEVDLDLVGSLDLRQGTVPHKQGIVSFVFKF